MVLGENGGVLCLQLVSTSHKTRVCNNKTKGAQQPRSWILCCLVYASKSAQALQNFCRRGTSLPPHVSHSIRSCKHPPAAQRATPKFKLCMEQYLIWSGAKKVNVVSAPQMVGHADAWGNQDGIQFETSCLRQSTLDTRLCGIGQEICQVSSCKCMQPVWDSQKIVLGHKAQVAEMRSLIVGR